MARGARKYPVPGFLLDRGITQEAFGRWLDKVTVAHLLRDRKRLLKRGTEEAIIPEVYRKAIYDAVVENDGRDYYTGEALDWTLLQYFAGRKVDGRADKHVPSVDHENFSATAPVFRICSMRTNKCKSDYSVAEVLEFAEVFIRHQRDGQLGDANAVA